MVVVMGLITLLASVGEEAPPDYTGFYVVGGIVAAFAVLISVIGFMKPDFPGSNAVGGVVLGLGTVLAAAAMATAVYVSS